MILSDIPEDTLVQRLASKIIEIVENRVQGREMLTQDQLAERLHLSKTSIIQYMKDGIIPYYRIKGRVWFDFAEVCQAMVKVPIESQL